MTATSPPFPRVEELPEDVTAKVNASTEVPEIEIKLFVGRVPQAVDEEVLMSLFQQYGHVTDVMILRDKSSPNAHRGAAFVRLSSIAHADAAIRALNNLWTFDPNLGALQVRYAVGEAEKLSMPLEAAPPGVNSAKLFVGSLPKPVTEQQIRELFEPFGTVDEVYIMKDPVTSQDKGCAFVKMAYKEQAHLARQRLNGSRPLPNTSRSLEVRFAESRKGGHSHYNNNSYSGRGPAGSSSATATTASTRENFNNSHRQHRHQGGGGGGLSVGGNAPQSTPANASGYRATGSNENPRCAGDWKEYYTDEGRPYYYNEKSALTQWARPLEFERLENMNPTGGRHNGADDIAGPPGANIFVFHVPNDWTRENLMEVFDSYGKIVSARIATDKMTRRNKGYAFVSYDNIQSAVAAVKSMDGYQAAPNKKLKVAIKQNEEAHVAHLVNGGGSEQEDFAPPKQTVQF